MDEFLVKISSNLTIDIKKSKNGIHDKGAESLETGEFLYRSPETPTATKYKVEI